MRKIEFSQSYIFEVINETFNVIGYIENKNDNYYITFIEDYVQVSKEFLVVLKSWDIFSRQYKETEKGFNITISHPYVIEQNAKFLELFVCFLNNDFKKKEE